MALSSGAPLAEQSLEIVGISGTSAGARNAGVRADGPRRGGASQARLALRDYLQDVGRLPGYWRSWPLVPQRTWHIDHNPLYLWATC
jgi:NTE family protein